jgi:hypothetical protein
MVSSAVRCLPVFLLARSCTSPPGGPADTTPSFVSPRPKNAANSNESARQMNRDAESRIGMLDNESTHALHPVRLGASRPSRSLWGQ